MATVSKIKSSVSNRMLVPTLMLSTMSGLTLNMEQPKLNMKGGFNNSSRNCNLLVSGSIFVADLVCAYDLLSLS